MDLLLIALILFALYWIPWGVALMRGHHQTFAIFVLNFLAGWTFIGWIAALVWACTRVDVKYEDDFDEPRRRYRRLR